MNDKDDIDFLIEKLAKLPLKQLVVMLAIGIKHNEPKHGVLLISMAICSKLHDMAKEEREINEMGKNILSKMKENGNTPRDN